MHVEEIKLFNGLHQILSSDVAIIMGQISAKIRTLFFADLQVGSQNTICAYNIKKNA